MTGCVLDACMLGPLILPDEAGEVHDDLLAILIAGQALVPVNWRLEVANMGRMGVRKRRMTAGELRFALISICEFGVTIDEGTNSQAWGRIFDLAEAYDLTMYDAAYLELALRRGAPLMTRDGPLMRAATAAGVALK